MLGASTRQNINIVVVVLLLINCCLLMSGVSACEMPDASNPWPVFSGGSQIHYFLSSFVSHAMHYLVSIRHHKVLMRHKKNEFGQR
jgi:hypothetical protein